MKKMWLFVKNNFLTKKFLSFGIIGVINTGIHMLIYWICYILLGFDHIALQIGILNTNLGAFVANIIAFIGASVFSYFANVIFTFKPKNKTAGQFSLVMAVFVVRMLLSSLLTWGFDRLMLDVFLADYEAHSWMAIIAPFFASALMIPIAYFALDFVFKKTDIEKKEE